MWELFKHSIGLCGEGHITIFHILGSIGTSILLFGRYIKLFISNLFCSFKKDKE